MIREKIRGFLLIWDVISAGLRRRKRIIYNWVSKFVIYRKVYQIIAPILIEYLQSQMIKSIFSLKKGDKKRQAF